MPSCRRVFIFLLFPLFLASHVWAEGPIKVGIFNNHPIVYYQNNRAQGLFVDVLEYVAEKEDWDVEYVHCGFGDCLKALKNNKLDLMTSMGETPERLELFNFSKEPVWTFWGTVYSKDRTISSILDLSGKKIAVRKRNKTTAALKKIVQDFNMEVTYVEYDNYEEAFKDLQEDKIETVAVNNSYAFSNIDAESGIYKTPIVFNPFSAFYAAPKQAGNERLLSAIDTRLRELKRDETSVYYNFLQRWYGVTGNNHETLKRVVFVFAVLLILVIIVMMIWRYMTTLTLNRRLKSNIEEKEKIQKELVHKMDFLKKSQEIGKVGSWVLDVECNNLQLTDEIYKIYGLTRNEDLSMESLLGCVHPEDDAYVRGEWARVFGGVSYNLEHRLLVDGECRWVRVKAEFELDENGECIRSTGLTQDITESKQAEKEKESLEKQLLQSQKLESLGRLAGGVAHDLNNLLSPIIGYSELLLDSDDIEQDDKDEIEQINRAGHKSSDLVKQLLAFSRKQVLEYKVVDLNEVIAGLETLVRRTIREDISMKVVKFSDLKLINADIGQLEQVLMNLAVNSADAMKDGGTLIIETQNVILDRKVVEDKPGVTDGQYVMLSISDTGHGMDKKTQENMFEPFFSTKAEKGTGLGLATVYGIVKQHNGSIWVKSEIGRGTVIDVCFPVSDELDVAVDSSMQQTERVEGTETILLVEDEGQVRKVATQMLKKHGYTVLSFSDGSQALDYLRNGDSKVDMLITDVIMPQMNGKELYDKVLEFLPDLKVLYMSGYTDDVIVHHGVLEDGVHFVQKPFSVKALLSKVRTTLDH